MRKLWFVAAGALLVSGCGTSDPAATSSDAPATTASTATADSSGDVPPARSVGVSAATKEVIAEYNKAYEDFTSWYREASDEEKRDAQSKAPKREAFTDRLMELVKHKPEASDAAEALAWVANSRVKDSGEALDLLLKHHANHESISKVVPGLAFDTGEASEKRLRELARSAPNEKVKGLATLALAQYLTNVPRMQKMVADNPQAAEFYADKIGYLNSFKENQEELESLYQTVIDNYASITQERGGTLGEAAEGALFAMRNLKVGKEVPEIEGADLDGVAFKLSDYRGKVVLLDFWGNW